MTAAKSSGPVARTVRIASRVSTLELLLDLVFVFTISQVAEIIVAQPTWEAVAQAAVTMALVWWMYDAFVWLTNQSTPDTTLIRLLLIAGMAGFLAMSLAIPDAFGSAGLLFGVSYLVVVLIHAGIFIAHGGTGARTMLRAGPINLVVSALLIASGFVTGPLDWVFFLLPLPLCFLASTLSTRIGLQVGAAHFVERHGLLMIIAFGESIVSVSAGLTAHEGQLQLALSAVATVAIVAALWWCYFTGDNVRAERAFGLTKTRERTTLTLTAFFVCHLVMILGLVGLAAGLRLSLPHAFEPASTAAAWLIAGGVAVYLVGHAEYRRELDLGPWHWRLIGAVICLACGFVGPRIPVLEQLAVLTIVVAAIPMIESIPRARSSERT